MINLLTVDIIKKLLSGFPRVAITVHRGPDGDAMGSALGWKLILKNAGIDAVVVVPDAYPDFLKWMPTQDEVLIYDQQTEAGEQALNKADLIFCLDFNAPSRAGGLESVLSNAGKPIIVVDHHQEPADFAQGYYVDSTASSTAELIVRLTEALGWENHIDRHAAICLYTGIVTDTGSFRFSSVSPQLLRIAADLLEKGIDHTIIYKEVFDSNSFNQLKLKGYALSEKLQIIPEAATAFISLTEKELNKFQFRKGDTEGLVNYGLSIKGVALAALFSESDGIIKISFRSKGNYDVNQLARSYFNGGGHINAAGGRKEGPMKSVLKYFREVVAAEAEKIKSSI